MHKVKLLVRVKLDGDTVKLYAKDVQLPFVPQLSMKFEQGISCRMWETADGGELNPGVEEIRYDFDEETIVCLFTVHRKLAARFWQDLNLEQLGERCAEMQYFRHSS